MFESVIARLVATTGIVGIGAALGAILIAADVAGWITGTRRVDRDGPAGAIALALTEAVTSQFDNEDAMRRRLR